MLADSWIYRITCIQRPLKGSNESGLLLQVVFKCRFYKIDSRRVVISKQWSPKAGGLLIQVVYDTGSTVLLQLHCLEVALLFMPLHRKIGGHIVLPLSICLSVHLSVCLSHN